MTDLLIDCATHSTKEALLRAFAAPLHFPDWFGGNLDALYDCLCDCRDACTITLTHTEALQALFGTRYAAALTHVLTHAAAENEFLTVCIFPQEGC